MAHEAREEVEESSSSPKITEGRKIVTAAARALAIAASPRALLRRYSLGAVSRGRSALMWTRRAHARRAARVATLRGSSTWRRLERGAAPLVQDADQVHDRVHAVEGARERLLVVGSATRRSIVGSTRARSPACAGA